MEIKDVDLLSDTPFVAVDLDVMERNIARMAQLAKEAGVKLRPHTKTHKSPYIARKQLDAGAVGITVAKLGEAEVMADAGIDDILIAFPLVGKRKLERFSRLLSRAKLTVAFDDIEVAKGINDVGEYHKKKIPVYIDVDTGLQRMGRDPDASAAHILEIAGLPWLEVRGLMSHAGFAYRKETEEAIKAAAVEDATLLYHTKQRVEKHGVHIPEISVGASATARFIKETPYATEMRPGMYVFNDVFVMATGGATEDDCAVSVVAIVARPTEDRIILDAGSKTLSSDAFWGGGYGKIRGHDNLTIVSLSEEHGRVEVRGKCDLKIGDVVQIIPNHICPAINLADELYGFRNGVLERVIPVSGRGKIR
jgi:D-serine deaminase-like pyridoxal phosphate-dependent protein